MRSARAHLVLQQAQLRIQQLCGDRLRALQQLRHSSLLHRNVLQQWCYCWWLRIRVTIRNGIFINLSNTPSRRLYFPNARLVYHAMLRCQSFLASSPRRCVLFLALSPRLVWEHVFFSPKVIRRRRVQAIRAFDHIYYHLHILTSHGLK